METIDQFIEATGVSMKAEKVATRPDGLMGDMTHWKCRFNHKGDKGKAPFITYYSQGSAYEEDPPVIRDVLDCLATDVSNVGGNVTFEEWADDLGFNTDSRAAEKIYNSCMEIKQRMSFFFGYENLNLLIGLERL